VPVFLHCDGQFDVDYKCYVACRNGCVYLVSKGQVDEMKIQIESKPVGMVRIDRNLVIAGMDNTIKAFTLKGKKSYAVQLPEQIVSISSMPVLKG